MGMTMWASLGGAVLAAGVLAGSCSAATIDVIAPRGGLFTTSVEVRLGSPRIWSISAGFARVATSPILAASYHATAIAYRISVTPQPQSDDALAGLNPGGLPGMVAAGRGGFGGLGAGLSPGSAGVSGRTPPAADDRDLIAQPLLPPPPLEQPIAGAAPVRILPVEPIDFDQALSRIVSDTPPEPTLAAAVPALAVIPLPAGGLLLLGALGALGLAARRRRAAG